MPISISAVHLARTIFRTAYVAAIVGTPCAAQPATQPATQRTALTLQALPLAPSRDSIAILAGGRAVGSQTLTLERRADGLRFVDISAAAGASMQQETEVLLAADGTMRRMHQVTRARGQVATSDLSYADGRVRGTVMVPGPGGPQTIAVDTPVEPTTVDDNAFGAVLPAIPWTDGATFTLPVFVGGKNALQTWTLAVTGRETVTVPAGTFDTFRVAVSGGPSALTVNVQAAAPHRVVRIVPTGAPVEFALAR